MLPLFGLTVGVLSFLLFAFASEPWMAFAIIPFSAFAGVSGPAINSITTSLVGKGSQGELQGAVASVQALGNVLSPLIMTQTLQYFTTPGAPIVFAGAPFLLAAVLALTSIFPFALGMRNAPTPPKPGREPAPTDVAPADVAPKEAGPAAAHLP